MRQLNQAVLYDFDICGRRVRFWKRVGESLEHIVMKALGFALYVDEFPVLEIEKPVGLRYKPDLVAVGAQGDFMFWGECGAVSIKKIAWLLKHARVARLVIFKFGATPAFAAQLTREIDKRYRTAGRITIVNFDVALLNDLPREISHVPAEWYTRADL